MSSELLKVVFHKDAIKAAKGMKPLEFVVRELGAIVERGIPPNLQLDIDTANSFTVTITTE